MHNDSIKKTLTVAIGVCVVCSVVVSSAAVLLRPIQEANRRRAIQENIVTAAGLLGDSKDQNIASLFAELETRVVDLDTGEYVDDVDPKTFDMKKAAKNPKTSEAIPAKKDIARIKRRANLGLVYIKPDSEGGIDRIILPVYGKGLWSTMYGFITLAGDLKTIKYFGFYQQGETPGLGGEVDADWWKKSWVDKIAFDKQGKPDIEVIKGKVDPSDPNADSKVDGIGGATITCRGVENLVHFWLGQQGYGPLLERLKQSEKGGDNG